MHLIQCYVSAPMHLRQVGGRVFPLEAVKQLEEMMDLDKSVSPHLSETSIVAVCVNPLLPQVFRPVCHAKGAGLVLSKLGKNVQTHKFVEESSLHWVHMRDTYILKVKTQVSTT